MCVLCFSLLSDFADFAAFTLHFCLSFLTCFVRPPCRNALRPIQLPNNIAATSADIIANLNEHLVHVIQEASHKQATITTLDKELQVNCAAVSLVCVSLSCSCADALYGPGGQAKLLRHRAAARAALPGPLERCEWLSRKGALVVADSTVLWFTATKGWEAERKQMQQEKVALEAQLERVRKWLILFSLALPFLC
jgi:hypothetical protein